MEITLHGYHGTAKYHAENINSNGFIVPGGNPGKAGYGTYFWEYISYKKQAYHLSYKWWEFSVLKNLYNKAKDCSCVIYDVSISLNEQFILNFHDINILEAFWKANPNGEHNEATYGAKLNDFIQKLEKKLNIKYEVVRIDLSMPHYTNVAFANAFPALILKVQKDVNINSVEEK